MTDPSLQQSLAKSNQLLREGRFPDAERALAEILQQHPDQPDALHLLGLIAFNTRQVDAARELVTRVIALRPDRWEYYFDLGWINWTLRRPDDAIAAYRRSIELKPDNPETQVNLAMALNFKGDGGGAVAACSAALALRSIYPQAWLVMGDALLITKNHAEAAACYKKAYIQHTTGAKLDAVSSMLSPELRGADASFWPDYHGPPLPPDSPVAKIVANLAQPVPDPAQSPDLDFLRQIPEQHDLPDALELFRFHGQNLPCLMDIDLATASGNWLTARNNYPVYFDIFQALARGRKHLRVLEIGVRTGYVGVAMARALNIPAIYVGIDPGYYHPDGLDRAAASFKILREEKPDFEYFLLEGYSWNHAEQRTLALSGPFDIIHIDGDHTLIPKLIDLELSRRLLAPGGYVLLDDYEESRGTAVREAVHRALAAGMYKTYGYVPTYHGMAILRA